ncbi:hypothetical protein BJA5080_04292 [Bradyrhizobium diazoefficiens SEMIA 5080]|uniref:Uncharacterized protein n=2 Tax=Nitrobacteraceae TaxID=41294 RepID=A0A837CMS1_9BRAD|nr:hypothetical protein BJA5080_04292 [Bradyrhizobium diazoefficiens SEMIA 5080]
MAVAHIQQSSLVRIDRLELGHRFLLVPFGSLSLCRNSGLWQAGSIGRTNLVRRHRIATARMNPRKSRRDQCSASQGLHHMSWKKKYAIGCLIALFVFTAMDSYDRPNRDVRFGAVIVMAAVWPVTVSVILGGAVGGMVRDGLPSES